MERKDSDFKVIISLKKYFTKKKERNVFIIYSPLNQYDVLSSVEQKRRRYLKNLSAVFVHKMKVFVVSKSKKDRKVT